MPKTERLYYTDCYLREFEARVLRVESAEAVFRVYLDRTAFYPESGGQPTDHGSVGGIPLLEAVDEGDEIAHLLERQPQTDIIKGAIDWERRFDHMQQHTGQHVLSGAFEKCGGYKTVSFHLSAEVSTIDLDSDRLARRQIEEAEELANQVVFENRPVRIFFQPVRQLTDRLDLRKSIPQAREEGDVRLVEVEDFDLSACGGTHVDRTGAIGLIAVRKYERLKGLTRVEFVCGRRALHQTRQDFLILSEAARLFSTGRESVPELIAKQAEELRDVTRAREKLVGRLAEFQALELWRGTEEKAGRRVILRAFPAEDAREAKMVAHALAKQPSTVALIGVKGSPAALFFSQSPGGGLDMGKILKETVAKFGGKGGGARDFAQGGGLEEKSLEEALSFAQTLISTVTSDK
jgi:alanyl-tRNA synthetase